MSNYITDTEKSVIANAFKGALNQVNALKQSMIPAIEALCCLENKSIILGRKYNAFAIFDDGIVEYADNAAEVQKFCDDERLVAVVKFEAKITCVYFTDTRSTVYFSTNANGNPVYYTSAEFDKMMAGKDFDAESIIHTYESMVKDIGNFKVVANSLNHINRIWADTLTAIENKICTRQRKLVEYFCDNVDSPQIKRFKITVEEI